MRQSKSCDHCRQSKKKCDGKSPCFRCVTRTGKICTYSTVKGSSLKNVDLTRIQAELLNIAVRRRYIEAFLEGGHPATYFCQDVFFPGAYDKISSASKLLQYNAILACATKAFGAPHHIYHRYERAALDLSQRVITEFSFDAAMGFSFLSYFYWGEDKLEADHYHSISDSLCSGARKLYENEPSKLALINNLQTPYFSFQGISTKTFEEELRMLTSQSNTECQLVQFSKQKEVPLVSWGMFNKLIDEKLLLFDFEGDLYDRPIDKYSYELLRIRLDVYKEVLSLLESPTRTVVGKELHSLLRALLNFVGGYRDEAFFYLNEALDLFYEKEYLIGLGGPQFIVLLHSVFTIACVAGRYDIATRVSGVQRKQAEIFERAKHFMEYDMNILRNISTGCDAPSVSVDVGSSFTNNDFKIPSENVVSNFQYKISPDEQSGSPFGWMTSVPIPIISSYAENK